MLEIVFNGNRREYAPGEFIEGAVRWGGGPPPDDLTVRLLHRTEGRGTQDSTYVDEVDINSAAQLGEHGFRFTVPAAPYTFDGTLISLRWFVEALADKETVTERITVSPWVETVRLTQVTELSPLQRLKQAKEQQQQQQQ